MPRLRPCVTISRRDETQDVKKRLETVPWLQPCIDWNPKCSLRMRSRQWLLHLNHRLTCLITVMYNSFKTWNFVSFNIKFGQENVPNNERLFSRWAWFSSTLIVNADRLLHSLTRWCWLTPFTLDPSVTSLVKLGHFFCEVGKNSIKLKTGGVDLKTILNKIPKISTFPLSAFADDMASCWGDGLVHSY